MFVGAADEIVCNPDVKRAANVAGKDVALIAAVDEGKRDRAKAEANVLFLWGEVGEDGESSSLRDSLDPHEFLAVSLCKLTNVVCRIHYSGCAMGRSLARIVISR
jgi:hypothetical protein